MLGAMRDPSSIKRARRMRGEPTRAEEKLWAILRGRRYRVIKFRRQHAIGPYVADFACVNARLVIEVDGPSHDQPEQAAFDAKRTSDLEAWGWRVARIPNDHIFVGGDAIYLFLDSLFQT
jgi:very-short-patch-repair endonuclease